MIVQREDGRFNHEDMQSEVLDSFASEVEVDMEQDSLVITLAPPVSYFKNYFSFMVMVILFILVKTYVYNQLGHCRRFRSSKFSFCEYQ